MKDTSNTYLNFKVGALFAAFGIGAGLIMAAAYISLGGLTGGSEAAVPALSMLLGEAAGSATAVTAYFAGVMGCMGAAWSLNVPKIAADMTMFSGHLASGKVFEKKEAKVPELMDAPALAQPDHAPDHFMVSEQTTPQIRKAQLTMRTHESFQELITKPACEASELGKR